eukprot:956218-Pleurochrysis_carterae.AAC.3
MQRAKVSRKKMRGVDGSLSTEQVLHMAGWILHWRSTGCSFPSIRVKVGYTRGGESGVPVTGMHRKEGG